MRSIPRRDLATLAALVLTVAVASGPAAAAPEPEPVRQLPAGFEFLPELGPADVFERFAAEGRRGVHSVTTGEPAIITKAVDLPLTATTEIEFEWRYDALPALGPETDAAFHDYHSIAVQFDNGRDITWLRSRELAPGTMFHCPLPGWTERETHIVLESGAEGLRRWSAHRRAVLRDYLDAVGGEAPARIVAVWFIANSYFGKQRGEAWFASVRLRDGDRTVEVFE